MLIYRRVKSVFSSNWDFQSGFHTDILYALDTIEPLTEAVTTVLGGFHFVRSLFLNGKFSQK